LRQEVHLHADEQRPVYAFGRTRKKWLSVVESSSHGSRAVLVLEVTVPDLPGQALQTQVRVKANGNQRFNVPVALQVAAGNGVVPAFEESNADVPVPRRRRSSLVPLTLLLVGLLLLLVPAAFLVRHLVVGQETPLSRYAGAIVPDTALAVHLDLPALRGIPGLAEDMDA